MRPARARKRFASSIVFRNQAPQARVYPKISPKKTRDGGAAADSSGRERRAEASAFREFRAEIRAA